MTAPLYERMAVIGCGLIGSSIARAARANGLVGEIVAVRRAAPRCASGWRPSDWRTVSATTLARLASAPTSSSSPCLRYRSARPPQAAAESFAPGATVTDVGSVKQAVSEAFAAVGRDDVFFIPGHPIAGLESSGPDAGFADLFESRWTILTPQARADAAYLARSSASPPSGPAWAPTSS